MENKHLRVIICILLVLVIILIIELMLTVHTAINWQTLATQANKILLEENKLIIQQQGIIDKYKMTHTLPSNI